MTIDWAKVPPTYETAESFRALALATEKRGLRKASFFAFQKLGKTINTYSSKGDENGRCELRIFTDRPERHIYNASKGDVGANQGLSGFQAYNAVDGLFQETHSKSMYASFSGNAFKKEYKDIKGNVPTQISYLRGRFANRVVTGVCKADVSSAFPSQIVGKRIPTLHGCKRAAGTIEPTEEYPFAFYVRSHHIAIYGELSTKELKSEFYPYYSKAFDDSAAEEETILCKGVEGELDRAFEYLYDNRKENEDFKFFMNACIGFFQKDSNPTLSMIAAVVIARCDVDMIRKCERLEKDGNIVLFIATDSIAWIGKESPIATYGKRMGSFTYEAVGCEFFAIGPKAYQIRTKDGSVVTKYAGVKKNIRDSMPFGQMTPEDALCDDSISCMARTKSGIFYPERLM